MSVRSRSVVLEHFEAPSSAVPLRPPIQREPSEDDSRLVEVKAQKAKIKIAPGWRYSPWRVDWVRDTVMASDNGHRFSGAKAVRDGGMLWKMGIGYTNKESVVLKLFSNRDLWVDEERVMLGHVLDLFIRKSGETLSQDEKETLFEFHLLPLWKAVLPKHSLGVMKKINGKEECYLTQEEALDFLWISLSCLTKVKRLDLEITIKDSHINTSESQS